MTCAVAVKSAMIEIIPDTGVCFTMLRFSGVQTREDIDCAMAAVIQLCNGRDGIRLYCDWSAVLGWTCEPRSLPVTEWVAAAAGRVERVAIVHHHRWNRQAAWFAAMLRRGDVIVRSWHLCQSEDARIWLLAP